MERGTFQCDGDTERLLLFFRDTITFILSLELLVEHHPDSAISVPEAAFRWIYNHSALDGARGDAVVIGASRLDQVNANLELSQAGPLKPEVVTFMDNWWRSTKHLCPQYFR